MNENRSNYDDKIIEQAFVKSLIQHSLLFPENESDFAFQKPERESENTLPDELKDPLEIIARGKITRLSDFQISGDPEVESNLAMAAREGKEIPDDVKNLMKKDKQKSQEKGKDEKGGK
ncbi:MAG: hypothetical protein ABJ004_12375 [Cyclobacteriaceae bacterium]